MVGWLKDAKEELFCVLICDGLTLGLAFTKAGFTAADKASSAYGLMKAPRIEARIRAILEARAKSPPVNLPEVTDMLKRVYGGALHSEEYNAAHNAAFSLARLHGLVVDRAQLDVIRRPSREPDAPAEVSLGSWIEALPALPSSPAPSVVPAYATTSGPIIEGSILGSDLDAPRGRDGTENGAPVGPVTEASPPGAHSAQGGHSEPLPYGDEGTGIPGGEIPKAEDLF
jgi:hypothetical protein